MPENIEIESTPVYVHDCDSCNFLGVFHFVPRNSGEGEEKNLDLYFCRQGGSWPTVIARESSEPSDYSSGFGVAQYIVREEKPKYPELSFEDLLKKIVAENESGIIRNLTEAALRAYKQGLLKEKDFYLT